jgi:hypothetical protein
VSLVAAICVTIDCWPQLHRSVSDGESDTPFHIGDKCAV